MADISRLRVAWAGSGLTGPGVSTFYFGSTASNPSASVLAFFTAIRTNFRSNINWTVPNTGDVLDVATGALVGAWTGTGGGGIAGSNDGGGEAAGVGMRVVWLTGGIRTTPGPPPHTYRVRGATFLVGMNATVYDSDGTPLDGLRTTITTAATTLIAAQPTMAVYSRPSSPGLGDGASSQVVSAVVPDRVSWLRSRRT